MTLSVDWDVKRQFKRTNKSVFVRLVYKLYSIKEANRQTNKAQVTAWWVKTHIKSLKDSRLTVFPFHFMFSLCNLCY